MFKLQALCANWAFINTRKSFKKLASPLINMLKRNIALERVNDCLDKVDALLWIRNCRVKDLALPYLTEFVIFIGNIIDIFLNSL